MNSSTILNRNSLALAVSLLALSVSGVAIAATDTENLTVSATVVETCIINSTTAVAFGNYDPVDTHSGSTLDNSAGNINLTCTDDSLATITIGQGSNPDGSSTDAAPLRQMLNGTFDLPYQLYLDSVGGTVWGDTTLTGKSYTGVGTAENVTVYGRIAAGQNVPAGSYTDTVLVTVTFGI
jgi:spore coat protein U-like protein